MSIPIEQTIIDWLKDDEALKDYVIAAAMPADNPQRAIIVEQTGANRGKAATNWALSVDVYAPTRLETAQATNGIVVQRLDNLWLAPRVADTSITAITHYPYPGPPVRERYTITLHVITATQEQ